MHKSEASCVMDQDNKYGSWVQKKERALPAIGIKQECWEVKNAVYVSGIREDKKLNNPYR